MKALAALRRRNVLILAEGRAHWSQWRGGRCLQGVEQGADDPCPWSAIDQANGCLAVVCDASLEIDRLASPSYGGSPIGRWQRARLARQRRRDEPATSLAWLGRHGSSAGRAAVHRCSIAPPTLARLSAWQGDGLSLLGIDVVEIVLARGRSRRAPPVLNTFELPSSSRHVLLIDGVACLSRSVSPTGDAARAVDESLAHARDRWMLDGVDIRPVADQPGWQHTALALAAWVGTSRRRDRLRAHALLSDAVPAVAALLLPSRERNRQRRLASLVLVMTALAIASVAQAIRIGQSYTARTERLHAERAALSSSLQAAGEELHALHPEPSRAAEYLSRASEFEQRALASPMAVLRAAAAPLSAHPALSLNALSWARGAVPDADGREELSDAPLFNDASHVPPALHAPGEGLLVELSGVVVGQPSLRQAQARAVGFVEALQAQAALRDCRLLESPLRNAAAAMSSVSVEPDPGADRGDAIGWRVRCVWQEHRR